MAALAVAAALLPTLMLALSLWNHRLLIRPRLGAPAVGERVSVLVPARNEERRLAATVDSLLAQRGLGDFEVIVLDDGSTDGTAALLGAYDDPRLRVIKGSDEPLPAGWLGKPWACHRLSELASGSVLVFADADVEFNPEAVAAAATMLRDHDLDLVSPFPRQLTDGFLEWLIQPWLTWLWLATMPLWWAARSTRESLSAANGQFLAVDAQAYRSVGGHSTVRGEVIDDINLMRSLRAASLRALPADGSDLAECRMYESAGELVAGYAKSLWNAFGGWLGSAVALSLVILSQIGPWLLLVDTDLRWWGAVGVVASLGSRFVAAKASGADWRSAPLQPLAAACFLWLNLVSWRRHLRGTNQWKGRAL